MKNLWNMGELPQEIEIPRWVTFASKTYGNGLGVPTCSDVAAIVKGGCASGAYMPAVTYYVASLTVAEHGDDILDYIQDVSGELPFPGDDVSWIWLAVFYLSCAVELWASGVESELEGGRK